MECMATIIPPETKTTIWIGSSFLLRFMTSVAVCLKAKQRAMALPIVIGMTGRGFGQVDVLEFKILYNTYVRPHRWYCIQAWSLNLVMDITLLKRVQRRATKIDFKTFSYEERLNRLKMLPQQKQEVSDNLDYCRRSRCRLERRKSTVRTNTRPITDYVGIH